MDAIAQHRKNLKRAEQAWVTDCDPVRRMAALRELFRDTHRLVNELLAAPGGARLPEAEELHRLLQRARDELAQALAVAEEQWLALAAEAENAG